MSEFKFACPVCGQHMMCDSSQGGSVMECPTCFQKINAPHAPASDSKFILTGTKVSDRPATGRGVITNPVVARRRAIPGVAIVLLIFVLIGVPVAYVYHGTIFKRKSATPAAVPDPSKTETSMLPPSDNTNWMLNLNTAVVPDAPAVGRVHGQSSTLNRVIFQGGVLTLRPGVRGSPDVSIAINFSKSLPATLAGQTINVTTNADEAAQVTLRWKENGQNAKATFNNGYALRLELGALANNRLPGKIYFCAPDDLESYVLGTFTAEIRKPKPKQ